MKTNKKHRRKIWAKDPHCYWCGKQTRLTDQHGGEISPDAATVDHLYSKLNPKRYTQKGKEIYVLSCASCNFERNAEEWEILKRRKRTTNYDLSGYSYWERKRRLDIYKVMVEKSVCSLVLVMGRRVNYDREFYCLPEKCKNLQEGELRVAEMSI